MRKQEIVTRVIKSIYRKIKNPFQSLFFYAKTRPLISFTYLLIFATAVFLHLFLLQSFGTLQWDEAAHSIGGIFISKLFLNSLSDPAAFAARYIADYPATIGALWFYPFGFSLFTSVGFLLLGFADFVARLISVIFSVMLIHATIRIAKEIVPDEKVALVSAFLVATSSIIVIVGTGAMVDIPQTTLMMYSLLFWVRGMKNQENKTFLKAGVLGGLAGLMKPTGIFVLLFVIAFQVLMFLISKDKLIRLKGFWNGIISGFLVFSTWWVSALVLKFTVPSIGESALSGVLSWLDLVKYIPPWYSPQWYTYEGWTYYANHLILIMGVLPFLFFFVGVCLKIKEMKRYDLLLVLFVFSTYALQSFASNKNPRYIITCLPILYIYSGMGLIGACKSIVGFSSKLRRVMIIKKIVAVSLIIAFTSEGLIPMFSAIKINYLPGMGFGTYMPIQECIQIIKNDGNEGIIILDYEDNFFNVLMLTFYVASTDNERKYGCHLAPSNLTDILSMKIGDKGIKYVVVHDLNSGISNFIQSNPESFAFIDKAENRYGYLLVYRVK